MKPLTLSEAPGYTDSERKKLAIIWRRIKFLEDRISEHRGNPSYDIHEAAGLRWLLDETKMPAPPKVKHKIDNNSR